MVGDHGQIIPFRRVKGIAMALITLATVAILAAVGLGFWGGWLRVQNAGLQSDLEASREAVRKLRDEKDLLMAKVVILEARTQKAGNAGPGTKSEAAPVKPSAAEGTGGDTIGSAADEKSASEAAGSQKEAAPEAAKPKQKGVEATRPTSDASAATPKVSVSAFIADHSPRLNTLSASFQIKNTGATGRKVAGRCVLVMKNDVESDGQWVSVPHVSLINGKPNGKQGRAFRIAHFMNLKMQTREVPANFAFETGTLYVFDNEGNQILEQEVPVQLSYRKPKPKPKPKPEPEPEPEPESQPEPQPERQPEPQPEREPERQPERQPESQATEQPQAASDPGPPAATDTPTASEATAAPSQGEASTDAPTPLPIDADEQSPASVTQKDEPASSPATPSPPAMTEGGSSGPAPALQQAQDPALLPAGEPTPATATPKPAEADTR